jgi:threonine/homoserine/homoserine lactone efflux protein
VDTTGIVAFAGVAAVLTVAPGADMALVTKNALASGRRAAFMTTLGIQAGCLSWAAASALGVAALLAASSTAFNALKIAGAAYLLYLGVRTIWEARRHGRIAAEQAFEPAPDSGAAAFRQGLLTNLLNPKIAVLYATLLPQFMAPGDPVVLKSLLLAGIHDAMGIVWLTAYAWVVTRAGDVLRRPAVRRALDRLTGSVLVALGLRLAAERR